MSLRILWRSTVFVITLLLIYLAFPILIVPSSLPAIQEMIVDNQIPEEFDSEPQVAIATGDSDLEIFELSIPEVPSLRDKIDVLKQLHQQGMDKVLQRETTD